MTTHTTEDLDKKLAELVLLHGSHKKRSEGLCVMEAVAWLAGEKHSDAPQCADPVITRGLIRLNDRLDDEQRQKLKPLIPLIIGTRGDWRLSVKRAMFIVDRTIRHNLAAFLRELPRKPREDLSVRLEGLPPIIDRQSALVARDLVREMRDDIRSSFSISSDAAAAYAAYAYADAYAYAAYAYADAYAYAAYAADAAAADAAADAYAYAAYAYAAYADDAYAYAAAAAAAAAADDADPWKQLRERTVDRSIETYRLACAITAEPAA